VFKVHKSLGSDRVGPPSASRRRNVKQSRNYGPCRGGGFRLQVDGACIIGRCAGQSRTNTREHCGVQPNRRKAAADFTRCATEFEISYILTAVLMGVSLAEYDAVWAGGLLALWRGIIFKIKREQIITKKITPPPPTPHPPPPPVNN
jgi:hypothetical protein